MRSEKRQRSGGDEVRAGRRHAHKKAYSLVVPECHLRRIVLTISQQQQQHIVVPASPMRNPMPTSLAFNPSPRQVQVQQQSQPGTQTLPQQIFITAFNSNPELFKPHPSVIPMPSRRIDAVAHAMWQIAFDREPVMKEITMKAAMLPQSKLRALARLNYLPSWWYLRSLACENIQALNWPIDDSEMQTLWNDTLEWCKKVESKFGVQGDNLAAIKEESRELLPVTEQGKKSET